MSKAKKITNDARHALAILEAMRERGRALGMSGAGAAAIRKRLRARGGRYARELQALGQAKRWGGHEECTTTPCPHVSQRQLESYAKRRRR